MDNENQEGKLAWAGGRKEEATYEAGDAEDKAVAAAAQQAAQKEALGPEVSSPCLLGSSNWAQDPDNSHTDCTSKQRVA